MTFIEAVQALKDGKCRGIKRIDWGDTSVWLMGMESLCICDLMAIGDTDHPSREMYSPSSVAVLADDWKMVNQRLPDDLGLSNCSVKYNKLVEYIKSLGCQADIDMLRIIGPHHSDTMAYKEAKRLRDSTWERNVPEFGVDLTNWPDTERRFYEITCRDVDNYENIYC